MQGADPQERAPEIVIIRRNHGSGDDGHHGGVWKIAYADFMTAMMAFFLVMWLINAANEATRAQVASYFNPIKLTDSVTSDKGLNKPKNKPKPEKSEAPAEAKPEAQAAPAGETAARQTSEDKLFKDPYAVLAQLAGEAAQGTPAGEAETGAATTPGGNAGLSDGEAYRDPFDPQAWRDLPALPQPEMPDLPEPAAQAEADTLRGKIEAAIRETAGEAGPGLTVEATGDGLLISLTDTPAFGMFAVGSAEPRPEVIAIMAQIARRLEDLPGGIVLRGHTDARPYRDGRYDNWRLSSARAQMAYYMLTRAGLDQRRVRQVEGHADRQLKEPGDPFAADNRRIEILLRKKAP